MRKSKDKPLGKPILPVHAEQVTTQFVWVNIGTWGIAKQVHATAETAKASWELSFSAIGKPTFVESPDHDLYVYHPKDGHCQVGLIQCQELLTRAEHL